MAGFQLLKNLNEVAVEKVRIASQAYTEGDAVMRDTSSDSVDVVPATSSTTHDTIYGVAAETVTSAATSLLVRVIEPSQVWECEVANSVSANHNFQHMVLSDANTVNNTGTDSVADAAIVKQVGILGSKGLFKFAGDAT
jgi:hypothetical protein